MKEKLRKGEEIAFCQGKVLAIVERQKKRCCNALNCPYKRYGWCNISQKIVKKPKVAWDYNGTMGGVDIENQSWWLLHFMKEVKKMVFYLLDQKMLREFIYLLQRIRRGKISFDVSIGLSRCSSKMISFIRLLSKEGSSWLRRQPQPLDWTTFYKTNTSLR